MIRKKALELHKRLRGKIDVVSRINADDRNMSLIYTPGVAYVSEEVAKDKEKAMVYTSKWNTICIVCDGTRVLGLGDIGPEGALPVMEGKAVLFKEFANVNAVPLCIRKSSAEEIIDFVERVVHTFGGVNIEDIESPKCLIVERELSKRLKVPVFHDDQNGTGIVVLAGLINALKIVDKEVKEVRVVVGGAGAGGYGITRLLVEYGFRDIVVFDSKGSLWKGREGLNEFKRELVRITKCEEEMGLKDGLEGADVFIGVTGKAGLLSKDDIRRMNDDAIVFPLTNPDPEIMPEEAYRAGAKVVGTGRSDLPNQLNNSLVFPGIFRGALDSRKRFNDRIYIRVAEALAGLVSEEERREGIIIPHITDRRVSKVVVG